MPAGSPPLMWSGTAVSLCSGEGVTADLFDPSAVVESIVDVVGGRT